MVAIHLYFWNESCKKCSSHEFIVLPTCISCDGRSFTNNITITITIINNKIIIFSGPFSHPAFKQQWQDLKGFTFRALITASANLD